MSVAATTELFNVATHNGIVTIRSFRTGDHRTVRIRTEEWAVKKDGEVVLDEAGEPVVETKRVAQLLCGPDNTTDYRTFAFVQDGGFVSLWKKHRDSKFYVWLASFLMHPGQFTNQVSINFEGRCRICNRALTTPESARTGLGPVCAARE